MILVTGGGGYLGSHLVSQLVAAGESVRVLEEPRAEVGHLPLASLELRRGDIRCREQVREAVRGCREVYHLAAIAHLWTRCARDFEAVNHQGTCHVLQEAVEAGAQRVLYISTESILAGQQVNGSGAEALRPREGEMIGAYCRSKLKGEQEAFRLADAGAPVIVACPTLPIGPGDHHLTPPSRMTLAFCQGKLPAYLDCEFNMIDVRDIAAGMRAAMRSGQPGTRYLLAGVNLRLIEWLRIVGRIAGRPAPRWEVPYGLALAVAYASEWMADHVTGQMPLATVTGVKLTRRSMFFEAERSRRELGLTSRSVEDSARDTIAWFREKRWL